MVVSLLLLEGGHDKFRASLRKKLGSQVSEQIQTIDYDGFVGQTFFNKKYLELGTHGANVVNLSTSSLAILDFRFAILDFGKRFPWLSESQLNALPLG